MALVINFDIEQSSDCSEFVLVDTTGTYSTLNPTGFGTPNPDTGDILTCTATFTLPDGTSVGPLDCTLPSAGDETLFDSSDLGLSGDMPEGVYTITYVMTDSSDRTYSVTNSRLIYCNTQCCLDQAVANFNGSTGCKDCNSKEVERLFTIHVYLMSAKYAASCNKPNKANADLANAQFLCNQQRCNCN